MTKLKFEFTEGNPWYGEPHEKSWQTKAGYRGSIKRNHSGALCGYIDLSSSHPWHGKGYDEIAEMTGDSGPHIHGGLTYAAKQGLFSWRIGFDCAHYMDLIPVAEERADMASMRGFGSTYRTIEYVTSEVEYLATQAKEAAPN